MIAIISLLGSISTLSLLALLFILAKLSERFGSVVKMKPYYRGYYVALLFLLVGYLTHLIRAGANINPQNIPETLNQPWFLFLTFHLPLTIGVTISLVITWIYWRWLVTES